MINYTSIHIHIHIAYTLEPTLTMHTRHKATSTSNWVTKYGVFKLQSSWVQATVASLNACRQVMLALVHKDGARKQLKCTLCYPRKKCLCTASSTFCTCVSQAHSNSTLHLGSCRCRQHNENNALHASLCMRAQPYPGRLLSMTVALNIGRNFVQLDTA